MALELPAPVAAYFDAKKRHDIDAMLAPFAADALVHDERADRNGHAEIRAWMEETTAKYADVAEPEDVSRDGEAVIVRALVSGTFPGSPIRLTHRFQLADDKITSLRIG